MDQNTFESAMEENRFKSAIEENTFESAIEENTFESAIEENSVESAIEDITVESTIEVNTVDSAFEEGAIEVAHAVLLENTNFHCILDHVATTDILPCLQVCKQWKSWILSRCTRNSSISISSCSSAQDFIAMKQKIDSFVSKYSKKKFNFEMTITSTQLNVDSPLFVQLVPNFAFSLFKLQLSLKGAAFGGVDDEVSLRNLLETLINLVELEMDLPVYACRFAGRVYDIRSAFDVVLTPPFTMKSLRKLIWREPLYLHKSDYLPVAFPSLTVCVVSLVGISKFLGSTTIDREHTNGLVFPNPPHSTSQNPLSISWPSLKKLTVEGYEDINSQFKWLHYISPPTELTHISLLNIGFEHTQKSRGTLSKFFVSHRSRHFTKLVLTRSHVEDRNDVFYKRHQEFLENWDCDFSSLVTLECDVTIIGNFTTTLSKMESLREFHLSTFDLQQFRSNIHHDVSKSCQACKDLWRKVFPVINNVKHFVLRGNHCAKNLNNFGRIFDKLECLEFEEHPGNLEIIRKAFEHIANLKFVSRSAPTPVEA